MKKFTQFTNEDLKQIGLDEDGEDYATSSSAFSGSKYDVLKKSKNDVYHNLEFQVHELMKKKPNLFCKILKNSKEQVLMEKLDTNQFLNFFEKSIDNLPKIEQKNFKARLELEEEFEELLNFSNSDEFEQLEDLQKEFINLKLEIYKYFQKFTNQKLPDNIYEIRCDLHSGNFGFIKGTKKIRCFDPIFINFEDEG